jgi:hypothetical protein
MKRLLSSITLARTLSIGAYEQAQALAIAFNTYQC